SRRLARRHIALQPRRCGRQAARRVESMMTISGEPMSSLNRLHLLSSLALLLGVGAASADPVEDFYKGKTITIVTSTGSGGAYDLTARALSRYMGKYLPGAPQFVIKNMPG